MTDKTDSIQIGNETYHRHPISAAWGSMSPEEYEALTDSMRQLRWDGEPADVMEHPDGKDHFYVVDGWHRMCAAVDLGISVLTNWSPYADSPGNLVAYINSRHCGRRNLNAAERARAVARANIASGLRPAPQGRRDSDEGVFTSDDVAKAAHASSSTAKRAIQDVTGRAERAGDRASAKSRARARQDEERDTWKEIAENAQAELEDAQATIVELKAASGEADADDAVAERRKVTDDQARIIGELRDELAETKEKLAAAEQQAEQWKARYFTLEEAIAGEE